MDKIIRVSHRYRLFFQALFYLTPIFTALFWLMPEYFKKFGIQASVFPDKYTLSPSIQLLGFFANLIPAAVIMYGLWQLIQLFKNYEAKNIFTLENAKRYHNLGMTFIYWVFANILFNSLCSVILTIKNSNKHLLNVSFSSTEITSLLIGGLIIIIAWVMNEGSRIAKEQSLTI